MVGPLLDIAHSLGVDRTGEFELEHGPGTSSGSDPSGRVVVPVSWQEFMPELVIYRTLQNRLAPLHRRP